MDLTGLTIKKAADGLRTRQFSALELTEAIFSEIDKREAEINAFLTLSRELAFRQAKRVDKLLSLGNKVGPLAGIPVAIKDVIVTKGIRTTAASKVLDNFIPSYDATVVSRLLNENCVLVGKTNCDEFAMGSSTENSAFKLTKNPHDLEKVPGGSSGGSAAAVAASFCLYALGSDTGGSIRQPAALCGVVGLKPTYGLVSRYGLIAMASSLDQIGPITKTVEDAAIVLNAIAGFDPFDATSAKIKPKDFTNNLKNKIKGLKIGLPREYFDAGLDSDVKMVLLSAIEKIKELDIEIVDISLPHQKYALETYYLTMPAEVSANLARYDGIRYGSGRKNFGAEVKRRIILGTYALSRGYYDQYYLKAAKVRNLLSQDFQNAFDKVDVILGPTSPSVAWKFGEKTVDPLKMYLSDIYTVTANLAGLPAISIPAGYIDKLPMGLQIIGPRWRDDLVLQVAHNIERILSVKIL